MTNTPYDVAIIGAGAVGCAIARELSHYDLKIAVLEANPDVGMGTSKASTAIWHTGFDAKPGSLEATLMRRSYPLMETFMKEVGSPFERIGGLLIAWNQEQLDTLPSLLEKAHKNGVTDVHLISKEEVYQHEPHLGKGALGGMFVPGEGILCTYTIPLACATQAVVNDVTLKVNFRVESISIKDDVHVISSKDEIIEARWVINAAGLFSDEINNHFGHGNFKVTPRRGELIVYDKLSRRLVTHVLLPAPTATTKGVLISPTIYGNVLLGPTAEDLRDKTATNTSSNGLNSLLDKGKKILPELLEEEVTATYAGLRAATEHSDYQIALHTDQHYICVGGIRSTGISASLGIAEYVADLLKEAGVELRHKPEFKTIKMPNIGEAFTRPYQSAELIAKNSDYGKIICHCERVTLGELNDAMESPISATTLDSLRRRTRAMQGRCQGFNCQAALLRELTAKSAKNAKENIKILGALGGLRGSKNVDVLVDVLIVGAGPAGLAAALELKKLGVNDIIVAERESEAGGIPRLCGHTGFGLRDLHRVMTGPSYARKYRELTEEAGIRIATNTTITGWESALTPGPSPLGRGGLAACSFTSPVGLGTIEAKSILLASGVRERPRAARLIPGHRPQGVFTTGSLQRFVFEHQLPVGKRAMVVGAEIVSLSVVTTLLHAGVKVVALVTELPNHQFYPPIFLPAKVLYADILARTPILKNKRVINILGLTRVEGVEVLDFETGKTQIIECDIVVFTGDWIPENELARRGDVEILKPSLGPQVDGMFRTSRVGVFAAGNLLRGVETADWAALEGRNAARFIARWLETGQWSGNRLEIRCEAPLAWVCPNVLSPNVRVDEFRFWSKEFRKNTTLQLKQGERVVYEKRIGWLKANVALSLASDWIENVDYTKEPVKLVIQP